jgi:excisionase family DNA binding protein
MENNQQIGQSEYLPGQLLSALQVAHILHISRSRAYNLMQSGVLATIQIGRSRRVQLQDLQEFITRNRFSVNTN